MGEMVGNGLELGDDHIYHPGGQHPAGVKADANGQADAGGGPQAGSGGQSPHLRLPLHNDAAGSQKTDAADHLGPQPGRIPPWKICQTYTVR